MNVTATDRSGNASSGSFTVNVVDTTAPSTATDAVSSPSVTHSPANGSQLPLGATVVTVTATDAAGNSASGSFTVNVVDTTAPSITCPGPQVAEATGGSGALVNYPPATGMDAISSTTITYTQAAGTQFGLGETAVTATATDDSGNQATCSFTVTVQDTTAPSLTCPASVTATAETEAGVAVSYPAATAADAVSTPTVTYGYSSGSMFPAGVTAVDVAAVDAAGNRSTCSFTVTVSVLPPPAGGCGCQASGGEAAFGWALAAALARLLRQRRLKTRMEA